MIENNHIFKKYLHDAEEMGEIDAIGVIDDEYARRECISQKEMTEISEFAEYLCANVLNRPAIYNKMLEKWNGLPFILSLSGASVKRKEIAENPDSKETPENPPRLRVVSPDEVYDIPETVDFDEYEAEDEIDYQIDDEIMDNAIALAKNIWMMKGTKKVTADFDIGGEYSLTLPDETRHLTFVMMQELLTSFLYTFIDGGNYLLIEDEGKNDVKGFLPLNKSWYEIPKESLEDEIFRRKHREHDFNE